MKRLILASTSPRRHEILAQSRLAFEAEAPEYEEDMTLERPPAELAEQLSRGKAEAVASRHQHESVVVLAADCFAAIDGVILGKPHTPANAAAMLHRLSGRYHDYFTGYTIIDCMTGKSVSDVVRTRVHFRELTETEIERYVATGEPLDKGGGYAIQGYGGVFIDRIEGDYYNVVGLPLSSVVPALRQFGIS
jgi:septum formation protein